MAVDLIPTTTTLGAVGEQLVPRNFSRGHKPVGWGGPICSYGPCTNKGEVAIRNFPPRYLITGSFVGGAVLHLCAERKLYGMSGTLLLPTQGNAA